VYGSYAYVCKVQYPTYIQVKELFNVLVKFSRQLGEIIQLRYRQHMSQTYIHITVYSNSLQGSKALCALRLQAF